MQKSTSFFPIMCQVRFEPVLRQQHDVFHELSGTSERKGKNRIQPRGIISSYIKMNNFSNSVIFASVFQCMCARVCRCAKFETVLNHSKLILPSPGFLFKYGIV